MRPSRALLTIFCSALVFVDHAFAQDDVRAKYHEPTRGFFVEHGVVAPQREASIELHSGSDSIQSGGGVRLGVPSSELIINSGLNDYDENQVLLKYALPALNNSGQGSPINWAIVGGFTHTDIETPANQPDLEQTNLKLGAAFTVTADAGTFTLGPRFVYADGDQKDDNFIELDVGAYVGIIDTQAGLFSAGVEALFTSADNTDDTFALGLRWSYDDRLNLDIVPLVHNEDELLGVPGLVRVNYKL